jgi:tetratricopeptide (TPR) repeat protein
LGSASAAAGEVLDAIIALKQVLDRDGLTADRPGNRSGSCSGTSRRSWPRQLLANPGLDTQALMGGADQARAIRALLGEAVPAGSSTEIAWAVRKLLERAAAARPLVVVLDDVHWGEQTFFELVEQVADLSRGAAILLLCLARPELLERRPAWGGGKLNATTVLLEPLNAEEAGELIGRLLPAEGLGDPVLRTRVLEAAAGNPLFLEEIAAIVASSGGDILVPPTIQALLAARLDQLEPGERRVLEWGSVEGNSFHRGAVEALGPEETSVPTKLVTLVRKDLVRPDEAVFAISSGWQIEMEAGQFDKAEEAARRACSLLEEMGERAFWSTHACELAQTLYSLGRYDEAETWARQGAAVGASDDAVTQLMSRQVLAKVAARKGEFDEARATAAEALAISDGMEAPLAQGDASLDAAEVLWLAGDHAAAIEQADRAASFFGQKGATVSLERARRLAETIASDRGDALPATRGRGANLLERLGE